MIQSCGNAGKELTHIRSVYVALLLTWKPGRSFQPLESIDWLSRKNTLHIARVSYWLLWYSTGSRGATTAEKLRGTNVWVPTPGRLRPVPGHRPCLGWMREGVAPPAVGVREYHPRKIFENSDAKFCILVTTTLINGLPRTCIYERNNKYVNS